MSAIDDGFTPAASSESRAAAGTDDQVAGRGQFDAFVSYRRLPADTEFVDQHQEALAERGMRALPLSFRSCVPFREIRLCDVDGVSDFFGVPGSSFGCSSPGCSLAALTVAGQGEDRGVQAGQRAGRAVPAVSAGGLGSDVGADEAEHGGERDEAGVDAGGSGGAGGRGGGDVVYE